MTYAFLVGRYKEVLGRAKWAMNMHARTLLSGAIKGYGLERQKWGQFIVDLV